MMCPLSEGVGTAMARAASVRMTVRICMLEWTRARLSWEDLCVLAVGGKTKQTDGDDAGVLLWRGWGCFKVGSGRGPLL